MRAFKIEIKWALIYTAAALAWVGFKHSQGFHSTRIDQNSSYEWVFLVISIVIYILALLDKRNHFFNRYMSWEQGLVTGMLISLIIAILSLMTQWIDYQIIAPHYFENAINYGLEKGQDLANLESYYNLRSFMWQSFVSSLSNGIILSAIISLFIRRKL